MTGYYADTEWTTYGGRTGMTDTEKWKALLIRALRIANTGNYRDAANLSLNAHPLWDDVREALAGKDQTR